MILIDGINGWFENYSMAQKAVIGMLGQTPADEEIALYVLSKPQGLVILQNYTVDHARLLQALKKYQLGGTCVSPLPGGGGSGGSDPEHESILAAAITSPCQGTRLEKPMLMQNGADSVRMAFDALAQALAGQPGRKSVYWITQGFPPKLMQGEYKSTWDQTIDQLNDANIAVNTVDSNGLSEMRRLGGSSAVQTVWNVAADTGGEAYVNRGDLGGAMASGIDAARSSYTLGYYLTSLDGDYHALKVSVDRPGVILSYRQGYFGQNDAQRAVLQRQSELGEVLVDPQDQTQIGITAGAKIIRGTPQGSIQLHLNLRSLSLTPGKPGSWSGRADAMFIEFNPAGKEVAHITETLKWNMNAAQHEAVAAQGLDKDETIKLAPGAVKLTIAIRDTVSGHLGSLRLPLSPAPTP